ncbi:MAG: hypothetical protein GF329_10015 [Candidatus Lokiarchaeota archaeon]|nr:hypothetical protein [Candidatus Lokiarchaeota archaeon]
MNYSENIKDNIREIEYILRGNDWSKFKAYLSDLRKKNINIPELIARISNIIPKISRLLMLNIQIYNINLIFGILRDINEFGLLDEIEFDCKTNEIIASKSQYNLIVDCLTDLFGKPNENFLSYIVKELPNFVINYLRNDSRYFFGESIRVEDNVSLIKDLLDGYTMYGLNIRKIADYEDFLQLYDNRKKSSRIKGYHILEISKNTEIAGNYPFDFLNFTTFSEVHLINDDILARIRKERDSKTYKYEFPIISMIVRGGLGPQGKGFSYLTPYNEICEICSDIKENKAYVLEYKKFLKRQFISELYNLIETWNISKQDKEEIIEFLDMNIQLNIIDSSQINYIYNKVDKFFSEFSKKDSSILINEKFRKKLKDGVRKILLPIELQDQFMLRMDLIKEGNIDETEVAKLVSLGNVSHYDMLAQRFFFQNLVKFMIRELKLQKK